jgi:hypothetical protein
MPITLTTADHLSEKWTDVQVSTAEQLFNESCPGDRERSQRLIHSSFSKDLFNTSHISPSQNGFVWAVFHAYRNHHHLTIRPDDVWFSILTQLGVYINKHAEELRSLFVAHEGKKNLRIFSGGNIESADFGTLALHMTRQIEDNVVDKELREWIMPDFTTTTKSDSVVAAILMMGALQKYFDYSAFLLCGIPSVTLLGERADWVTLVKKLDRLYQLGDEPARFAQLLRPVLNHFVASFDAPESPSVRDFWGRCAHKEWNGSGPTYLSGWVSVFCFWNNYGYLLHKESIHPKTSPEFEARNTEMELDDALSRRVDTDDVPSGYASVPLHVNDNGVTYETMMVAGSIGIQATSLNGTNGRDGGSVPSKAKIDSIQPLSGWWMYEKKPEEKTEMGTSEN